MGFNRDDPTRRAEVDARRVGHSLSWLQGFLLPAGTVGVNYRDVDPADWAGDGI
jgi:hypothetical protein